MTFQIFQRAVNHTTAASHLSFKYEITGRIANILINVIRWIKINNVEHQLALFNDILTSTLFCKYFALTLSNHVFTCLITF